MLKKLEEKYAKTLLNRLHLVRKFFRLKLRSGLLWKITSRTLTLCEDLDMDVVVSKTYKALCLVNTLLDEYENLVDLLLKGEEKLNGNEIEVEHLNYAFIREDKRKQSGEYISSPEALFTRSHQGKGQGARGHLKSKSKIRIIETIQVQSYRRG